MASAWLKHTEISNNKLLRINKLRKPSSAKQWMCIVFILRRSIFYSYVEHVELIYNPIYLIKYDKINMTQKTSFWREFLLFSIAKIKAGPRSLLVLWNKAKQNETLEMFSFLFLMEIKDPPPPLPLILC